MVMGLVDMPLTLIGALVLMFEEILEGQRFNVAFGFGDGEGAANDGEGDGYGSAGYDDCDGEGTGGYRNGNGRIGLVAWLADFNV